MKHDRSPHRLRAAVTAAALTGALAAPAAVAATGGMPAPATRASWCPAIPGHRVECGKITRPLVNGRPDLGTTPVAYALVRRSHPDKPRAGTLIVNPGGPGAPAIAEGKGYARQFKALLTDHDLLLVDPRGTGLSGQLNCHVNKNDVPHSGRLGFQEGVARCAADLGPKAAGYTSAATADDFDAVRAELGIDKLVLFGSSYGTYLMPIYAQRHPDRVASIVLTGAYPLNIDPLGRDSAQAVSTNLRRICARSGGACDGEKAVRDLTVFAARLRATPLKITLTMDGKPRTVTFNESMLASATFTGASSGVGENPTKPSLLGGLPYILDRAAKSDYEPLRTMLQQSVGGRGDDAAQSVSVVCNDYPRPYSVDASIPERRRQFAAALGATRPGAFGAFSPRGFTGGLDDLADACITWPREGTARPYVSTGHFPDVPVLVLSGDLDANTTEAAGRLAAAQFKRATFIVVPNMGHTPDADPGGCVTSVIVNFIRTGKTGPTTCINDLPPITVKPVR
ncbi:alpha/beta fold hydrolase [Sinosporangium album]|uniref:alpha/beta fold hydrolase n=1 Tax=Sinosporangium album TaxID=504805 RepID=UPI001C40914D|nr:alpha/beta fold hydrolase [Sinosporangium album]